MFVDIEMTISFVIDRINVIHIDINVWILQIIILKVISSEKVMKMATRSHLPG